MYEDKKKSKKVYVESRCVSRDDCGWDETFDVAVEHCEIAIRVDRHHCDFNAMWIIETAKCDREVLKCCWTDIRAVRVAEIDCEQVAAAGNEFA